MCIASLKHLQKGSFNTNGHFSTLNYDPSSGINFQRGHYSMRGGVVKIRGSIFLTLRIDPQSVKIDPGSHFSTGSLFNVTPAVGLNLETGQMSRHFVADISLNVTLNLNQPTLKMCICVLSFCSISYKVVYMLLVSLLPIRICQFTLILLD